MAIEWYELPDDTLISAAQPLAGQVGVAGTASAFAFWNHRGGTGPTLYGLRFVAVAETTDPDTSQTINVTRGVDVLDRHEVEARIVGGLNKTGVIATDWQPLGAGRSLLPASPIDLAQDEGVEIELRVRARSDTSSNGVRVFLRPIASAASPTAQGLVSSGLGGVLTLLGDGGASYVAYFDGGVVENPGGADDQVSVGDLVWVHQGRSYALLDHLVTISDVDGDSSTLVAGESYWVAISAADGTLTQTKGPKSSSTPVRPSYAAGEVPIAKILRAFDGLIEDVDIENGWTVELLPLEVVSGRTVRLGAGWALVGDALVYRSSWDSYELAAGTTSTVWLLEDGSSTHVSDGSKPADKAEALYDVVCDATDVTSIVDRRRMRGSGPAHLLTFTITRAGGLQVADESMPQVWASPVDGELRLIDPVIVARHDAGSGLSSGGLKVDVEVDDAGTGYGSIYPGSGTDDRRVEVAYDATDPVSRSGSAGVEAIPTVRVVPAWARLKAVVAGVPTGTTPPAGVTVVVVVEEVRR